MSDTSTSNSGDGFVFVATDTRSATSLAAASLPNNTRSTAHARHAASEACAAVMRSENGDVIIEVVTAATSPLEGAIKGSADMRHDTASCTDAIGTIASSGRPSAAAGGGVIAWPMKPNRTPSLLLTNADNTLSAADDSLIISGEMDGKSLPPDIASSKLDEDGAAGGVAVVSNEVSGCLLVP